MSLPASAQTPRRILIWSDAFPPQVNGVAAFVVRLAVSLRDRGCRVGILTSEDETGQAATLPGVTVWRLPLCRTISEARLDRVSRMLEEVTRLERTFAPDLIHIHSISPSVWFHLQTASATPVPTLYTLHRMLPTGVGGPETVIGRALRAADWVTVNSDAVLRDARRAAPEIAGRSSVIPLGIPAAAHPPTPLPWNPPRLLCVGRVVDDKGFDLAIRAMLRVRPHFPHARLLIAGEGAARPDLERLVRDLRLEPAVEFLGQIPPAEVRALMAASTMLVMPSRCEEAFGLVVLEAADLARPVVATRVGGVPEVVEHGQTGLLVDREDPDALARAMLSVLQDRHSATVMGQNARRRVEQSFRWQRCASDYLALYARLLAASPPCSLHPVRAA